MGELELVDAILDGKIIYDKTKPIKKNLIFGKE
jgi:hypothetical protein